MKYAIYGTGECALEIYYKLKDKMTYFIDDNPRDLYEGYAFPINNDMLKDVTVLMGVFNEHVDPEKIKKELFNVGYTDIMDYIDVHKWLKLPDRFWLNNDKKCINRHLAVLNETYVDTKNKYFPKDFPTVTSPLSFIDCGAYDGDTIRKIIASKIDVKGIIAYEPCIDNYNKLSKYISNLDMKRKFGIIALPYALWSRTRRSMFDGMGENGKLAKTGEESVQCYRLDDSMFLLEKCEPNYIKMDIEGAELEALKGARETITKFMPQLAIALYHRPNDLFLIPALIKSWDLPYDYYIRSHGYNGLELFLYCVPKSDAIDEEEAMWLIDDNKRRLDENIIRRKNIRSRRKG